MMSGDKIFIKFVHYYMDWGKRIICFYLFLILLYTNNVNVLNGRNSQKSLYIGIYSPAAIYPFSANCIAN